MYTTQIHSTFFTISYFLLYFHITISLLLYLDSVRMTHGRACECVYVYHPDIGWSEE